MLSIAQHRLDELALLSRDLTAAAFEQQVGESDDRVERGPELVRHVGQKLALELSGPLELLVLAPEGRLVAPALRQHRGTVEAYDHLVSQNLQQLNVMLT